MARAGGSREKIRVVVADDHPIVRLGICNALRGEPDIEIVGEATNGLEAVQLVEALQPDVFILDVQMPEMDGVAVARHVRARCPDVRILLSPQVASKVVQHTAGKPSYDLQPDQLTEREMEVLRLMAQVRSNEEIAEALCITERTVRFHVSNLFNKLQVTSRIETVVKAIRLGLIKV